MDDMEAVTGTGGEAYSGDFVSIHREQRAVLVSGGHLSFPVLTWHTAQTQVLWYMKFFMVWPCCVFYPLS